MRDERRQQLLEQYEEAAISLLMDEYAESEGAKLLLEYENAVQNGEPEIPVALDEKCRQLIDRAFAKQQRRLQYKKLFKSVTKVAAAILVFLGLITTTVLSVDALRIPVLNFLMDQSGRYSTVMFDKNSNAEDIATNEIVTRFENNIPDGYEIIRSDFIGTFGTIGCSDANNHIIYLRIAKSNGSLSVDTEGANYTEVGFGQYIAAFREKDGYYLMWLDEKNEAVYTLFANGLHIDVFWEFAYILAG